MAIASVSALLVVRNEEQFLGECLESIGGCVDEIVVVDTGSTDNTIRIARDFGARILEFVWIGDFAAARNFAIDSCQTDWAFYIDADERVVPSSRQPINRMVDESWLAADILLRPKANYTRYRLTRLFRIDPRIRFRGAIHETIQPSLEAIAGCTPMPLGITSLEVDHYGYEGDLSAKHARNLPLLERCVREFPERVFYWFHLTETLLGLGRFAEARSAGLAGIQVARRRLSAKSAVDAAMICQMLSAAMLDRASDPLGQLQEGLCLHPENYGLLLTMARRDLRYGDAESSLRTARFLQSVDPDTLVPGLIAYDRDIFSRYAAEMEIASLSRLGRRIEAAQAISRNASRLKQ